MPGAITSKSHQVDARAGGRIFAFTHLFRIKSNSENEIDSFARSVCVCVCTGVRVKCAPNKNHKKVQKVETFFSPEQLVPKMLFSLFFLRHVSDISCIHIGDKVKDLIRLNNEF